METIMKKMPVTPAISAQPAIKSGAYLVAVMLAQSIVALSAHAESHASPRVVLLTKYQQECSSCHVAYPPGMLPAASWQRVTAGLNKHYGVDASLDAASSNEIGTWLAAHAGTYRRISEEPPQDRITQSTWFKRQHRDGEVPAGVWKRASIKGPSNCAACHPGADKGNFNEDDVRIPK
jgi:hypothetical protein